MSTLLIRFVAVLLIPCLLWDPALAQTRTIAVMTAPSFQEQAFAARATQMIHELSSETPAATLRRYTQRASGAGQAVYSAAALGPFMLSGPQNAVHHPISLAWLTPAVVSLFVWSLLPSGDIAETREGTTRWGRDYLTLSPLAQAYVDVEEAVHRGTTRRLPIHQRSRFGAVLRALDEGIAKSMALIAFLPLYGARRLRFVWLQRGWTWYPALAVDRLVLAAAIGGLLNFVVHFFVDFSENALPHATAKLPVEIVFLRSDLGAQFFIAAFLIMGYIVGVSFHMSRKRWGIKVNQVAEGQKMISALRTLDVDDFSTPVPAAAKQLVLYMRHLKSSIRGPYAGSLNMALRGLEEWSAISENRQWLANRPLAGLLSFGEMARLERWLKVDDTIRNAEGKRVANLLAEVHVPGVAPARPLGRIDMAGLEQLRDQQRNARPRVEPFVSTAKTIVPMDVDTAVERANQVMLSIGAITPEYLTMRRVAAGQRSLYVNVDHSPAPFAESLHGLAVDVFESPIFDSPYYRYPPSELRRAHAFEEAESHGGKLRYYSGDPVALAAPGAYDHMVILRFSSYYLLRTWKQSWLSFFLRLPMPGTWRDALRDKVDAPASYEEFLERENRRYEDLNRFVAARVKPGSTLLISLDPKRVDALKDALTADQLQFSDRLISKLLPGLENAGFPVHLMTIDARLGESPSPDRLGERRPIPVEAHVEASRREELRARITVGLAGLALFPMAFILPNMHWIAALSAIVVLGALFTRTIETWFKTANRWRAARHGDAVPPSLRENA